MNFQQRIALDRWVAAPVAVIVNAVVRVLGLLLRRNHRIDRDATQRIVVCKLVGMGSVIQATPLLRALKRGFPHARITFVTLEANRALLARLDHIDDVICLNDRGLIPMATSTARLILTLLRQRVDHYFDLEVYSSFSCLLSVFSLAHNRLGFYRHSNRYKRGIYTHLVYFNTRMPVRRLYLQLGRVAGVVEPLDDRLASIRIDAPERQSLRTKLAALGMNNDRPYVLVNPNASDLLLERRWPEGHLIEALEALARAGRQVALMGSPSEAAFVTSLVERLTSAARAAIVNTAGQLTLAEAFALVDEAACVLTNDTGPMHMAFALARPTVSLIGPADPVHYSLDGPQFVTLYARVACSPCIYEIDEPPCSGNNVCMQRLDPAVVVEHVIALLEGAPAAVSATAWGERQPVAWETDGRPLGIVVRDSVRS